METALPIELELLRIAYPTGTYNHPGPAYACASQDLLLREHMLTCLYWYGNKNPLSSELFLRSKDVLPSQQGKEAYMFGYRIWGQIMSQARHEGLAVQQSGPNFLIPGSEKFAPELFFPSVSQEFLRKNCTPEAFAAFGMCGLQNLDAGGRSCYDMVAVRTREVLCLIGIFLEYASARSSFSDFCQLWDRTLFTLLALNPVLRLGMPLDFGLFIRKSVSSIALYCYQQEALIQEAYKGLPSSYYADLLESLAALSNLLPSVVPFQEEGDEVS